jgi:hypothetical protein
MKKRINVKSNKTERDGVIPWNYSLLPIRKNYEGKMNHQQKEVTSNHVCYYPEKKIGNTQKKGKFGSNYIDAAKTSSKFWIKPKKGKFGRLFPKN